MITMSKYWLSWLLILLSIPLAAQPQNTSDPLDALVNIDIQNQSYVEILKQLEKLGDFSFAYQPDNWSEEKISIQFSNAPLRAVLAALFKNTDIRFFSKGNRIFIVKNRKTQKIEKRTLNGYLYDATTGETLIGATVMVKDGSGIGAATNAYGFFALSLPVGTYTLQVNYIGYETSTQTVELTENQQIEITLKSSQLELNEVVIEGKEDESENVSIPQMSKTNISIKTLKQIPTIAGEPDVMKALQLTPGVLTQGEGSSNIFVRGGSSDQNLILLDEAPVYNPSHLMGFFSVFNSDALKDVSFYRGGIPAQFGGRLSSVLDLRMKEGNNQKFSATGGIGTLASRLTLEDPIKKDKSSFIVSGRRTYADLFLKFSGDEFTRQTAVYFYDLNAKANFKLGKKDKLFVSGYFGRDVNKVRSLQYSIDWGNATATTRWNHLFNDRLFSNTTLVYSNYNYLIDLSSITTPVNWKSTIRNVTFKEDLSWYANQKHLVSFGLHSTFHHFRPGYSEGPEMEIAPVPESRALEHAIYVSDEFQVNNRIRLNYGLRYSLFQLLGGTDRVLYRPNGEIEEIEAGQNGRIYQNFGGLEPRFSASYQLSERQSFKFSYQRTRQYLHTLSNINLAFNVFDIWMPASQRSQPQIADQLALGYVYQFNDAAWELNVEVYYKQMQNQLDYKDHSRIIMNRYIEGELLSGDAKAYGLELQLRKQKGNLTGWMNYTYSRVFREIDDIDNGEPYPANYDQPHNFQTVLQYRLSNRVSVSANWVVQSGRPITLPTSTFYFEGNNAPIYGARNAQRLPTYHRLDLSIELRQKYKPNRKNSSSWQFGLYNAYNRLNASTAFVSPEIEDIDLISDRSRTGYYKLAMFGILPSVTYNFKF